MATEEILDELTVRELLEFLIKNRGMVVRTGSSPEKVSFRLDDVYSNGTFSNTCIFHYDLFRLGLVDEDTLSRQLDSCIQKLTAIVENKNE